MSDTDDGYPSVPHDRLLEDGWERRSKTEEQLFETGVVSVTGYTLVYADEKLQQAIEAAGLGDLATQTAASDNQLVDTGGDGIWRFFFATALSFRPPLAPGIGPASVRPMVTSQAKQSFADDLKARGFEEIQRGSRQRLSTDAGDRATLWKFRGSLPIELSEASKRIDIDGWLGIWVTGGSFRIAGGAYPTHGLEGLLASAAGAAVPSMDAQTYREDLFELIKAVQ